MRRFGDFLGSSSRPEDSRSSEGESARRRWLASSSFQQELFENAQRSVLIGGYAFDHGKEIFGPLHVAMAERGVETTIFLNDAEGFLEENWPFGEPHPSIYCDPRTAEKESRFSLHAKCIVVDEARALVTSANFTDRGQTRNLEIGVLVDDPGLATRLVHQWRGLIESGLVTKA
ncbi:MAG: phospholipase D-like domain-containing protein [Vicinamibacteria bacterium]